MAFYGNEARQDFEGNLRNHTSRSPPVYPSSPTLPFSMAFPRHAARQALAGNLAAFMSHPAMYDSMVFGQGMFDFSQMLQQPTSASPTLSSCTKTRLHSPPVTSFSIETILGLNSSSSAPKSSRPVKRSACSNFERYERPPKLHCSLPLHKEKRVESDDETVSTSTADKLPVEPQLKNMSTKSSPSSGKSKRVRTIFTPDQLERLELEFERQQYMVGPERLQLADTLSLSEAQVKVWFQNRRIKWRKQNEENNKMRFAHLERNEDGVRPEDDESSSESGHDEPLAGAGHLEIASNSLPSPSTGAPAAPDSPSERCERFAHHR